MAHTIKWLISRRVILGHMWGMQTLTDLEQSTDTLTRFIHEGLPPVHYIADMNGLDKIPIDIGELTRLFHFAQKSEVGWFVIVGLHARNIAIVIKIIAKILQIQYKSFNDMNSAMVFLQQQDPTLNFFDENASSSS